MVIYGKECNQYHGTDKSEIKLGDDAEGYQVVQAVSILIVPVPFGRVYCDAA